MIMQIAEAERKNEAFLGVSGKCKAIGPEKLIATAADREVSLTQETIQEAFKLYLSSLVAYLFFKLNMLATTEIFIFLVSKLQNSN